jgi:PAS domain S-box-containing protein
MIGYSFKRPRLRTPVTIAALIGLVVLGIAATALTRSLRNQDESWRWVVHTREVLEHVQAVLTQVSDAEASQRGFLLTGNEAYAVVFTQARRAVHAELAILKDLTADNVRQQASFPHLSDLVDERMAMLDSVMERRRAGNPPDTGTLEAGRVLKQRIVMQTAVVRNEEQRLLAERQRRSETARQDLIVAVATLSALSVGLIVLLWVISSRDAVRMLAQSARLEATLRGIGDGVIATDLDGKVQLMNPVAEALTGMLERDAAGQALAQILALRDEAGAPIDFATILQGNRLVQLTSRNGREYVIETHAAPIAPPGGKAAGTVFVLRDVTERNARERALAESEANYRYTIELNPQIPWKASPEGAVYGVSERWLTLTGQTQAAVNGDGWGRAVHAEDFPAMSRAWMHAVATGEPFDAEHRVHTADGTPRWMRSRANPRRDDDGAIVAWYGLTEDIHARKESELALTRREAELKARLAQIETIYRAVPIGLGYVDSALRLVELNEALAAVTGRPKEASIGRTPSDVLPAPLGERVAHLFTQVLREQVPVSAVEFSDDIDAESEAHRDWLGSFYPVIDDGRVQGIIVALLDVTPIKAAQRKLVEANELLEQRIEQRTAQIREANEELRAFAHTVAHDLRAPLRNVEGFATALLEDEAERMSEDGRLFAGRIVAAVTRMDRLITDLLAYSRLSRAEMQLDRVDAQRAVDTALRDLETQIADSRARIEVVQPLPAVLANQAILVQVLDNLIANAVKFVAPGVAPRVRISGSNGGATSILRIEDNGIGIAPDHHEHVFGVFERLHGQEQYPGTGIGLAIVRKGIERMGGSVRIMPRQEGGTAFVLTLPSAV